MPPTERKPETWENFKRELSNWGNLTWKIENLSQSTVFLYLNIQIKGPRIQTSTHQKDMNLYLYIPPMSAHPKSCLKGLIAGEMKRYWIQNNAEDFKTLLVKFLDRLRERGHTISALAPHPTKHSHAARLQHK